MTDAASVNDLTKGADVVAHLAFAILSASDATRELNVNGSRMVFEAAAKAGAKRIVTRPASRPTASTTTTRTG